MNFRAANELATLTLLLFHGQEASGNMYPVGLKMDLFSRLATHLLLSEYSTPTDWNLYSYSTVKAILAKRR